MSDKWQNQIAQLSLDLIEMRAARADAIDRMRDARATVAHARNQNREQISQCNEEMKLLREKADLSAQQLAVVRSQMEHMGVQMVDYQTALMHRTESECNLRDMLRTKENELQLKTEVVEQQAQSLERELSEVNEELRTLRAMLMSEQRASSKVRQDLEISNGRIITLEGQITKMKAEAGILKANWQNERSRALQLEQSEPARLIRERDQLRIQVDKLEAFTGSATNCQDLITERDERITKLVKEMGTIEAALQVKDNIIEQFDTQLSELQNELQASSTQVKNQNSLIEDLYKRLKERSASVERASSQLTSAPDRDRHEVSNPAILKTIWHDIEVTKEIIASVLGENEKDLGLLLRKDDYASHSPGRTYDLSAIRSSVAQLRQQITSAVAAQIGESCAVQ